MQKSGVLLCPACHSDKVAKFSDVAESEFRCEECGCIFGSTNFNTPEVPPTEAPSPEESK